MNTLLISTITSVVSLLSICLFGATYLFYKKYTIMVKANSWLFVTSSFIGIMNLIVLSVQSSITYSIKDDVTINIETIFLLINVALDFMYFIWIGFKNHQRSLINSKWEKILDITLKSINYLAILVLIIFLIIFTVGGDLFNYSHDGVANSIQSKALPAKIIFLLVSIIFWIILLVNISVKSLTLVIQKKKITMSWCTKLLAGSLSYLLTALCFLFLFIAFDKINDKSNWFASEFLDFILKEYTNSLWYIEFYSLIFSAVMTSITFVPELKIKEKRI